jgi:hypothetical protein
MPLGLGPISGQPISALPSSATVPVEGPGALVLVSAEPVAFASSVSEDFPGAFALIEDAFAWTPLAPADVAMLAVSAEDFAGSLPADESPVAVFAAPDVAVVALTSAEDFGGAHPTEDGGAPPIVALAPDATWQPSAVGEDFAGSLPLDETGPALPLASADLAAWASFGAEDFAGSLPLDESPGVVALQEAPPVDVAALVSGAEDFAGALVAAEDGPGVMTLDVATSVAVASTSEEFAPSPAFDESPSVAPAWLTFEPTVFAVGAFAEAFAPRPTPPPVPAAPSVSQSGGRTYEWYVTLDVNERRRTVEIVNAPTVDDLIAMFDEDATADTWATYDATARRPAEDLAVPEELLPWTPIPKADPPAPPTSTIATRAFPYVVGGAAVGLAGLAWLVYQRARARKP